ncbi:MAG: N-acyl-D-amino-acid deacylase family protein [Candidatus Aminicenantales bacterium]
MKRYLLYLLLAAGMVFFPFCTHAPQKYDLGIINGRVMDGSGNPWFRADIGIKGKRIVAIENRLDPGKAKRIIDASGLVVCPGFIDIHTHADDGIVAHPTADNYIHQGVTTVIGGNCGGHEFPLAQLWSRIREQGISCNFGSLAGHNTIRKEVMGMKMASPTKEEMERMKALLAEELEAGALGLSTGLAYLPGTYSTSAELVELGSVVKRYGGFYASHIRNQGKKIREAIEEAIRVGEENDLPVEISHIKLADEDVWNRLELILEPVEAARARGVEVTLDQYPYTATSSGFTSSLPQDVFEGGKEKFLERMKDPQIYARVKEAIIHNRLSSKRGINRLEAIYIARSRRFPEYEGKNLEQILKLQGKSATVENGADLIIDIVKEGDAQGIFFQMDEKDVEALMKLPYTMIGSDGRIEVLGQGHPHPRSYGTFSRVCGEYVRNRQLLPLEEAVRKMTSLPAQTLRLRDRGLLRDGMYADIIVFDPKQFEDRATFSDPHQYSQGLVFVLVNGELVIDHGKFTGKKPGMMIFGPGYRRR